MLPGDGVQGLSRKSSAWRWISLRDHLIARLTAELQEALLSGFCPEGGSVRGDGVQGVSGKVGAWRWISLRDHP